MYFYKSNCLLIFIALFISACGYVSDKPPANIDVFRANELTACKIDVDKLAEIFKSNQEDQIRCLKENFIQYTRYVKTKSGDSVNEDELNDFVKNIFKGQSESVSKGLSIIFQLNMLLLKDEAKKISKGNITPFFELLVTANREAIIITESLKAMSDEKNQDQFYVYRKTFNEAVTRFAETTLKIMSAQKGQEKSLNIKKFIQEAALKLGNVDIEEKTIDSILFVKQILVSGDKEFITTQELESLIEKLPKILQISFDIYFSEQKNFNSISDQSLFYLKHLQSLNEIIDFNQKDFFLITIDDLLKLSRNFTAFNSINFERFSSSIKDLKKRIIGQDENKITLYDLKIILDTIIEINEQFYFDQKTFDLKKELLLKPEVITINQLGTIDSSYYQNLSEKRIKELSTNLNQILLNFRYYRENANSIPFYGTQFIRSRYGLVENSLLRIMSKKLLKAYGHKTGNQYQVNIEEFEKFLLEMKPILEHFKLWSPNFKTFARNSILLGDLFQHQSNGDLQIDETETTEYIQMILSASKVSNDLRQSIPNQCQTINVTSDTLYKVSCFNNFFFSSFLNKLNYKKYFPRLNDYVSISTKEETLGFLSGIEGFARDINDPKLPINERDSILILGAMINVETTFIRYDLNRDNILDFKELMEAFKVYKQAIISLAGLSKEKEIYAPSVFLYMVTKMAIPPTKDLIDNLKFYAYHKCVHNEICRQNTLDRQEAKRLNIGALLYYIVNEANKSK